MALNVLRENWIYAKFCTFDFIMNEILCLGHITSKDGVAIDQLKWRRQWSGNSQKMPTKFS